MLLLTQTFVIFQDNGVLPLNKNHFIVTRTHQIGRHFNDKSVVYMHGIHTAVLTQIQLYMFNSPTL